MNALLSAERAELVLKGQREPAGMQVLAAEKACVLEVIILTAVNFAVLLYKMEKIF